ncbi:MAG: SEC-C metal-binding domain-containing protein [Lachnospiraceae bacterium]|nr:SEC-C metal-binding domain-containing protein [Lachnospiraceae bacterium]
MVNYYLDPETIYYRAAILNDKEIAWLDKGMNGPAPFSAQDILTILELDSMCFIAAGDKEYRCLSDVAEVLQAIRTPEFEAYRKRASWVWMCLSFAEYFYGYIPMEHMLNLVNCKRGFRMDEEELIEIFDHFPRERVFSIRFNDYILELFLALEMDEFAALRNEQADKAFYIPSVDEVIEFYETHALLSDHPYQKMLRFLEKEMGVDHMVAKGLLEDLWNFLSSDADFHGTMQWFWDQFEFENDQQIEKIIELYMKLANGTRMRANRGHKPGELHAKAKMRPGQKPVIQAGSTKTANLLSEIAPELQQMGFSLDLDSNADSMSVIGFPNGMNSQPVVSEKKIYPNDPCPCGSGKKYKKCCGR